MRTRLTTLALVTSVLLVGTAAFAQQSQSGTAYSRPSASRSRMTTKGRMHRAKMRKATAARHMKIMVDGRLMRPSTPPLMRKGRVMVPMRSVFQDLGANVHWIARRHEVITTKDGRRMDLRVGRRRAIVNGRTVRLDAAPIMHRNRVYVPLRTVSESLGGHVAYIRSRREVVITTAGRAMAAAPGMQSGSQPRMQAGLPRNARAIKGAAILVDGTKLKTTAEPVMVGTVVLVPAQAVFEELKANPTWNASEHRLTATYAGERIVVTAGDRNAMVGGRTERLSHAPFVHNNQVYVPLDFMGKALKATTKWEASRKEVVINTQARPVA